MTECRDNLSLRQEFVSHECDTSELGPSRFATTDVHRIGILDIRLYNTDRCEHCLSHDPACLLHDPQLNLASTRLHCSLPNLFQDSRLCQSLPVTGEQFSTARGPYLEL